MVKDAPYENVFNAFLQKFDSAKQEILKESVEIAQDYSDFLHFYTLDVKPSVLVLGKSNEAKDFLDFIKASKKHSYEAKLLLPQDIVAINGHLGDFEVKLKDETESYHFAQIVLFYEDEHLQRFMGCENAGDYESAEALMEVLDSRIGDYQYHNIIHYDSHKCQYHQRRPDKNGQGYCHQCADVCPTFGVTKDDSLMELQFSALDCISCGACVMVCPSGSVQRDGYTKESLYKIAKLYKGRVPVVLAQADLVLVDGIDFKESLPLILAQPRMLNEVYLLSLVQESGAQVVLFDRSGDMRLKESVDLINAIFNQVYQKQAIFLANDIQELQSCILQATIQDDFYYTYYQQHTEALRQIFSERLKFVVLDGDFGEVVSRGNAYGEVFVDKEKCTLCMGCVGACNVQSLSAGDFSLLHNPSLCTACGYCVDSCPENAISVDFGKIALKSRWFEANVMASDSGFRCVECGKVFANTKAVEKIKNIMTPIFGNDATRLRTLECCETCKVKVMFGV